MKYDTSNKLSDEILERSRQHREFATLWAVGYSKTQNPDSLKSFQ